MEADVSFFFSPVLMKDAELNVWNTKEPIGVLVPAGALNRTSVYRNPG